MEHLILLTDAHTIQVRINYEAMHTQLSTSADIPVHIKYMFGFNSGQP
jgi:hypothetical protein